MDNITTAAAGLAATAGIEQMITTADNINTSWNRLELTFKGTGVSMDTLKNQATALSESTGRSGGVIRDYFNQMGIAGVTNTDLLSSSFEALSGKAYQTGNSIETMENKMQMMAMTGNASGRMLRQLGIDAEDLGRAMGMSAEEAVKAFKELTPEERIQAITKAMGDGAEANEMYKESYAGLKDRASAAMAGLAGAVGQAILPIVIPALEAATNFVKLLTDGFKALPAPVQGVIGGILGFVAIATTLIGTLGMVGKVIGTVKTGLETLRMLGKITSIISSIGGAFSSLWGVLIANPIILVVVAIVALIAALVWAYYNVDWFREMVDNAWKSIQGFASWIAGGFYGVIKGIGDAFNNAGQTVHDAVMNIYNTVVGILQGVWDYITTLGGLLPSNVEITGNQIVDTILRVLAFIVTLPFQIQRIFIDMIASALGFGDNFTANLINGAMNAVSGFTSWIGQLPDKVREQFDNVLEIVQSGLQAVADYILSVGGLLPTNVEITGNQIIDTVLRVIMFIATLPMQLEMIFVNAIASALGFGNNFSQTMMTSAMNSVNGFVQWISQLPGKVWTYLNTLLARASSFAGNFANNIIQGAVNAVNGFMSWISSLPDKLRAELDKMLEMASNFAMEIANTLTGGGAGMVIGWLTGSGEHSPGYMYDALVGELEAMVNAPGEYLTGLISNIAEQGYQMGNALTESLFGMSLEETIASWIMPIVSIPENIQFVIDWIMVNINSFIQPFWNAGTQISMAINQILTVISQLPSQLWAYLSSAISRVIQFGSQFVSNLVGKAQQAVQSFSNAVQGIPQALQSCLDWAYNIVMNSPLVQALEWLGQKAAEAFSVLGLGQQSPGKIVKALRKELTWSEEEVNNNTGLSKATSRLGSLISDSFKPELSLGFDDTANASIVANAEALSDESLGSQVNNFYFNDIVVDDDSRMQKIVDYVVHELKWNNKTAGRTV